MKQEKRMDLTIKFEEAAITALAIYFLTKFDLGLPVWAWFLLFFSPDLSMVGYVINTKIGSFTYNLFHHRGIAVVVLAVGVVMHLDVYIAIGLLLIAHSSFDRMLGYGLKYADDFKHTNLGWMGKAN